MHFYVAQDQLAKALSGISRIIMPQNNKPILAGIQLEAYDQSLLLTATDLFTTLKSEISVEVKTPGEVVLPASLLSDLVQRIPTATIEIETDGATGKTAIKYGRNRTFLHGVSTERLPEFPGLEGTRETIQIGPGLLPRLSRQLLFACAKDETRPILKGVSVQLNSGRLMWAATDGSRLSYTWIPVPEFRGDSRDCVVPAKMLAESARLNTTEEAQVTIASNIIEIRTPSSVIMSRLLDGQYPEYQRVIPQDYVVQGRIQVSELRGALERANLLAVRDRVSSVRIRHQVGQLEISASAAEFGQAFESLDFDSHGPDLDLLFNPHYFLDALKSLEGDEAILEFSGLQSPVRVRDTENAQYSHIILPLRQLV